jgi:hypothetical protein
MSEMLGSGPVESLEISAVVSRARELVVTAPGSATEAELAALCDRIRQLPGALSVEVRPARVEDHGVISSWHRNRFKRLLHDIQTNWS